jgi:serine/threonine-protein kinase
MVPGFTQLTVLGEGGFGRVVLARHDATSRVVAIKYLAATDEPSRAHFRHEAAILRRVSSQHVARLYEFVETKAGAAIVMEAVPGVSLKEILARHGTLAPEAALAILKGSLLGLAAAHAAGTVHRDYKPGNVLVQPNHQSKLVDFGIALLSGHSGLSSGTPAYMAPEQWQGGPATPATDVYAATCVFFLCVTGFRPFTDSDTERLRHAHQFVPPPVEQVPEQLRGLVARGMAKDVTRRPAGAAAFVAELEAAAVAGYGTDWEPTGWQRLAGFAGALLSVSPMAWLVSSTGVLTSAGGTAAGTVVGGAGAKAAAGALAAKVAAAIVGVAVVAGGAVVVINTIGDDPPAASQEAFAVVTKDEKVEYPVNLTFDAQVVEVTGVANSDALNAALRAPLDARVDSLREDLNGIRDLLQEDPDDERWDDPVTIKVSAAVLLANADYVSVRYYNEPNAGAISNSSWQSYDTVTVDRRTGKALAPTRIYRPGTLDRLADTLLASSADRLCADNAIDSDELDLAEANLGTDLTVAFTREHATFTVDLPAFGRINACGIRVVDVPYADLTEILDPALVTGLTAG